jgi:hypothetical protein
MGGYYALHSHLHSRLHHWDFYGRPGGRHKEALIERAHVFAVNVAQGSRHMRHYSFVESIELDLTFSSTGHHKFA